MDVVANVRQPSTLRMLTWLEASNGQNNMAAVSADGSTVCVLILHLNSSLSRSTALVMVAHATPLARRQTGEEPIAGFLQAACNGSVFEPLLPDENFAAAPFADVRQRFEPKRQPAIRRRQPPGVITPFCSLHRMAPACKAPPHH
jgi:hypothetical protein